MFYWSRAFWSRWRRSSLRSRTRLRSPTRRRTNPPTNAYTAPFDGAAAGMTRLFDGKTLDGWVGNPECWKVVDGAIIGVRDNQLLMTAGDYDDFRLIVSSVQVRDAANHQGIGFWGERPPAGRWDYGGCLLVMPPMPWMWDYAKKGGPAGKYARKRDLAKELGVKRSQWTQAEILVNRAEGSVRMAVNGIEVLDYVDSQPGRFKKGPVGLQAHGGNKEVRYKDVFIEVAPKQDRLITLSSAPASEARPKAAADQVEARFRARSARSSKPTASGATARISPRATST